MNTARWMIVMTLAATLVGCTGRKAPDQERDRGPLQRDYVLLNPRLAPEDGTWGKPVEEIGRAPREPWSASTVSSAVEGEPLEGEVITLVGEVIDLSIYIQTGAHGKRYKRHMEQSAQHNGPIGLLTGEGKCLLLLAEEYGHRKAGATELRPLLVERLGDIIKVTGTAIETGGMAALYIHGFMKNE